MRQEKGLKKNIWRGEGRKIPKFDKNNNLQTQEDKLNPK